MDLSPLWSILSQCTKEKKITTLQCALGTVAESLDMQVETMATLIIMNFFCGVRFYMEDLKEL